MGSTNRYVTGMILAAAIVFVGGFYVLRGTSRSLRQNDFDMSYSMPRPKNALYNFFFGLGGREIERIEVNPFKGKETPAGGAKAAGVPANAAKIPANVKKAAVVPAKPAAKSAAAPAKPQVKVSVVNAAPEPTAPMTDSGPLDGAAPGKLAAAANPPGTSGAPNETKDKNGDKLSSGQWRALIQAQPTKENIMKLVTAFNNKEVDSATLYLIMNELMQSSNSENQKLGLLIGQSIPSLQSFNIVSDNYEKLDSDTKKNADAYLETYMQGSRLGILALALQSENTAVVFHATQTLVTGLGKVKNNPTPVVDGNRYETGRGIVASSTGKTYSGFVTILQKLASSSDGAIASMAQTALSQIQAMGNN